MARPSHAFESHRGRSNLRPVPNLGQDDPPYERIVNGDLPPMMFQIRLADGQRYSFCYSDVRRSIVGTRGEWRLICWRSLRRPS